MSDKQDKATLQPISAEEVNAPTINYPKLDFNDPSIPKYYATRDFNKEEQFLKMYGSNASKRDRRKFEKYWESDKRWEDQDAFERAEHQKWLQAFDARQQAIKTYVNNHTAQWKTASTANETARQQRMQDLKSKGYFFNPKTGLYTDTPSEFDKPATDDKVVVRPPAKTVAGITETAGTTPSKTPLVGNLEGNQDWHNYMSSKYQKVRMPDGTSAYKDSKTGMYFYNDGQSYNPSTRIKAPYKWEPLKQSSNQLASEKSYLNGKDSYRTGIIMQKDFDSLFNKYLGGKYYYKSESHLPEDKRTVNFTLIRQDPLYKQAWEEFQNLYNSDNGWLYNSYTRKKKDGGIINKHQQGGIMNQQELQQQVVQLVQAAMQGDQKASQQIEQIIQAAKNGDQQATQIAQMIQAVAKQMQGQATAAKWGAKLKYIKSLKYAKGGKACPTCMSEGGDINKPAKNNTPDTISKKPSTQKPLKKAEPVKSAACGGKAKKRYFGGWL